MQETEECHLLHQRIHVLYLLPALRLVRAIKIVVTVVVGRSIQLRVNFFINFATQIRVVVAGKTEKPKRFADVRVSAVEDRSEQL